MEGVESIKQVSARRISATGSRSSLAVVANEDGDHHVAAELFSGTRRRGLHALAADLRNAVGHPDAHRFELFELPLCPSRQRVQLRRP